MCGPLKQSAVRYPRTIRTFYRGDRFRGLCPEKIRALTRALQVPPVPRDPVLFVALVPQAN